MSDVVVVICHLISIRSVIGTSWKHAIAVATHGCFFLSLVTTDSVVAVVVVAVFHQQRVIVSPTGPIRFHFWTLLPCGESRMNASAASLSIRLSFGRFWFIERTADVVSSGNNRSLAVGGAPIGRPARPSVRISGRPRALDSAQTSPSSSCSISEQSLALKTAVAVSLD